MSFQIQLTPFKFLCKHHLKPFETLNSSAKKIKNSEQFSKENQILNSIMVEPDVKFGSCLFFCFKNDFKNNLKKFIFIFFLFQINIVLIFPDHFDMLMLKIIFKK